jgi:hypothetical protein
MDSELFDSAFFPLVKSATQSIPYPNIATQIHLFVDAAPSDHGM